MSLSFSLQQTLTVAALSIIIVNYNSSALIVDCLLSLDPIRLPDTEIIIVDNCSKESGRAEIENIFQGVVWIDMGYNAGFARANNEGIRRARGEAILLLNPDTLVHGNSVAGCYRRLMESDYIACGVQLLNPDGSQQISGNYFMKGSLNNLLPLPYVGRLIRAIGYKVGIARPHLAGSPADVGEVDWINGAFLMVKKTAIDRAGLMDGDFFLYAEEAEWCYRLRKHGRLAIFNEYRVTHLQGESSNEAFGSEGKGYYNLYDRKGLQFMLSNFVRIRKQNGVGWLLIHMLFYSLTVPVFLLAAILKKVSGAKSGIAEWKLARGFAGNVVKLWKHVPVIISNKPHFYKVL